MDIHKYNNNNNNITHTTYNVSKLENENIYPSTEKKIYIPTYVNKFRVIGCLDSGSDLTIMHSSLYYKIRPSTHWLDNSENPFITTLALY